MNNIKQIILDLLKDWEVYPDMLMDEELPQKNYKRILAKEISDKIKKEYKVVASGKVNIILDTSYIPNDDGTSVYLDDMDIGEVLNKIWDILEINYDKKHIEISIRVLGGKE